MGFSKKNSFFAAFLDPYRRSVTLHSINFSFSHFGAKWHRMLKYQTKSDLTCLKLVLLNIITYVFQKKKKQYWYGTFRQIEFDSGSDFWSLDHMDINATTLSQYI